MNKEQLTNEINAIPEFVFRQAYVDHDELGATPAKDPVDLLLNQPVAVPTEGMQAWRAVTTKGSHEPIAFVSARYQLVQFKDSFLPLLQDHMEVDGKVIYNRGTAIMDFFPIGEQYQVDLQTRIGLTAYNSVDKTSALIIRFTLSDAGGRHITLPKDVSQFYKAHTGKVQLKAQDYMILMSQIKDYWVAATQHLAKVQVTPDNFDAYVMNLEADGRVLKILKAQVAAGSAYNLWELYMKIYDDLSGRYAKSDVHMRKRLDAFVSSISMWTDLLSLSK